MARKKKQQIYSKEWNTATEEALQTLCDKPYYSNLARTFILFRCTGACQPSCAMSSEYGCAIKNLFQENINKYKYSLYLVAHLLGDVKLLRMVRLQKLRAESAGYGSLTDIGGWARRAFKGRLASTVLEATCILAKIESLREAGRLVDHHA